MSDLSKPPEGDDAPTGPAAEPTRPLPAAWERIPKTIPHTRARTSTVVLVLLFVGLLWWYLDLYAQFVPEEQRRTGQPPAATSTAPPPVAPTSEAPVTTAPSRVPSSTVRPSGEPSRSGAPSSTVPGASGESGASGSGDATTTSGSGGIVLPGGVTVPVPSGGVGAVPSTGGAPTTTVPPG